MWVDPRPGRRCKHCRVFAQLESVNCPSDTYKRKRIYALDYACDNFEETSP